MSSSVANQTSNKKRWPIFFSSFFTDFVVEMKEEHCLTKEKLKKKKIHLAYRTFDQG